MSTKSKLTGTAIGAGMVLGGALLNASTKTKKKRQPVASAPEPIERTLETLEDVKEYIRADPQRLTAGTLAATEQWFDELARQTYDFALSTYYHAKADSLARSAPLAAALKSILPGGRPTRGPNGHFLTDQEVQRLIQRSREGGSPLEVLDIIASVGWNAPILNQRALIINFMTERDFKRRIDVILEEIECLQGQLDQIFSQLRAMPADTPNPEVTINLTGPCAPQGQATGEYTVPAHILFASEGPKQWGYITDFRLVANNAANEMKLAGDLGDDWAESLRESAYEFIQAAIEGVTNTLIIGLNLEEQVPLLQPTQQAREQRSQAAGTALMVGGLGVIVLSLVSK